MNENIAELLDSYSLTAGCWEMARLAEMARDERLASVPPVNISEDRRLEALVNSARSIARARHAGEVVEDPDCDGWDLWQLGCRLVIPTNTQTRRDGTAVMGAGLAKAAAVRWPSLPAEYGAHLAAGRTCVATTTGLLLVPTKEHWRQPSTIDLVEQSLVRLAAYTARKDIILAIPAIGAGLGGLDWPVVAESVRRIIRTPAVLMPPRHP